MSNQNIYHTNFADFENKSTHVFLEVIECLRRDIIKLENTLKKVRENSIKSSRKHEREMGTLKDDSNQKISDLQYEISILRKS